MVTRWGLGIGWQLKSLVERHGDRFIVIETFLIDGQQFGRGLGLTP
jgi:hypothetical protein